MSDQSYFNIFLSKSWACPSCVPVFTFKPKVVKPNERLNYVRLLRKLAKLLNPLRNQYAEMYSAIKLFS